MSRILDQLNRCTVFPFDNDYKDLRGQFDKNGADVATIRSYGAKFGKGVAVEPGITNLETQSDFETLLRAWNATDGDNGVIGGTPLTDGWRQFVSMGPTTSNSQIYHQLAYTVSTGQRLTMSCLFRFNGSKPTFNLQFDYNAGTDAAVSPTLSYLGKGVWHAMATTVVPASATAMRGLNLSSINWGSSTTIDLLEGMVFVHAGVHATVTTAIRTSHTWGTRAGGVLRYPGWLLPREEGTVSLWLRPNYNYSAFENSWRDLVRATTTASNDEFRITIGANAGAPGAFQLRFWASGVSQKAFDYQPGVWDVTQLYHLAVTWSSKEVVQYFNGVRRNSGVGQFTRWTETAEVRVGCNVAAGELADGLIDDLAIFRKQLTDEQIATIYA